MNNEGKCGIDLDVIVPVKEVVIPSLTKLKTEKCTPEELQLALVKIIELHNGLEQDVIALRRQQPTAQARFENMRYGL